MSLNKYSSAGNLLVLLVLFIFPVIGYRITEVKNLPMNELLGLFIMCLGYVILVVSKYKQIIKFDFFTFGTSNMSKRFKQLYYLSYAVMGLGLVILLVARNININP